MNYHNITYPDQNNGDGLRVVLWISGCEHHCKGCQNPQTWDYNGGIEFDQSAKEEIFKELSKPYISGITLSGGDPLASKNLKTVYDLVNEIRLSFPQKTIWMYTGYTWEQLAPHTLYKGLSPECIIHNLRAQIINLCDVVIDGEYIDELRDVTLHWRGSSNQRVIDVKETFRQKQIILWRT